MSAPTPDSGVSKADIPQQAEALLPSLLAVIPFLGMYAFTLAGIMYDYLPRSQRLLIDGILAGLAIVFMAGSTWALIIRKRPAWLATWLAAGVVFSHHGIICAFTGMEFEAPMFLTAALMIAAPVLCWRVRRLRLPVLAMPLVILCLSFLPITLVRTPLFHALMQLLLVAAAIGLFASPRAVMSPYVFLFTFFTMDGTLSRWDASYGDSMIGLPYIISAAATWVVLRVDTRWIAIAVLSVATILLGIFMECTANPLMYWFDGFGSPPVIAGIKALFWFVVIPSFVERYARLTD